MANYLTSPIVAVSCAMLICCLAFAESANSPFLVAHKRVSHKKLNSDLERVSVSIDIYNAGSEYSPFSLTSISIKSVCEIAQKIFLFFLFNLVVDC